MNYKLYKVTALMEMGDEPPVIFTFDLPAPDGPKIAVIPISALNFVLR